LEVWGYSEQGGIFYTCGVSEQPRAWKSLPRVREPRKAEYLASKSAARIHEAGLPLNFCPQRS